jgi:hypothetical protein
LTREVASLALQERAAKARADAVASLSQGLDPAEYDASTGIRWSSCFTDVPDDGNCMIHAVWLGLRALHQHYPALAQVCQVFRVWGSGFGDGSASALPCSRTCLSSV